MAILNQKYYHNEQGYSDGDELENEILKVFQNNESPDDFLKKDKRWASFYHLSPYRQNILSWYPFKKDTSLLEVGAGPGALTGMFCRKVKSVTSVELTKSRGLINYERNKDQDNLEIIIGNFHNIHFTQKYDYIVLNGVLEYAASFTDTENPYHDFLQDMKALLKPDGVLLIAIENRLGLKYLNGAAEDHTSQLFSGINDYKDIDFVRTFSENELKALINEVGFKYNQFFYPLPDYKFPLAVVRKESSFDGVNDLFDYSFNNNRLKFYSESNLARILQKENILSHFFNSFLVEISDAPIRRESRQIEYVKLPLFRRKEFALETTITEKREGKVVLKSALFDCAKPHLDRMLSYYQDHPTFNHYRNTPSWRVEDDVAFNYVEGKTLATILLDHLNTGNMEAFEEEIRRYSTILRENAKPCDHVETAEFKKVFGDTESGKSFSCHKVNNIDLTLSNIIRDEDEDYVIDYEWVFDFEIPIDFIIWRGLYFTFMTNKDFESRVDFDRILATAGVNTDDVKVFEAWNDHFNNDYVTNLNYTQYFGYQLKTDDLLNQQFQMYNQNSTLSADFGEGFGKEITSLLKIFPDHAEASFNLDKVLDGKDPKQIVRLRFNPTHMPVAMKNIKINSENDMEFSPVNAINKEGTSYFYNYAPTIIIQGEFAGLHEITLSFDFDARITNLLNSITATDLLFEEQIEKNSLSQEKEALNSEIKRQSEEIEALQKTIKEQQEEIERYREHNKPMDVLSFGKNQLKKIFKKR